MKVNLLLPICVMVILTLSQSCSTTRKQIWVAGYKSECSAGAGKSMCLLVNESDNNNSNNWKNFYAPIIGYTFRPGYLQQIEVKEKKLKPKNVPADGSSVEYTFLKVIQMTQDTRSQLEGGWTITHINDKAIDPQYTLPSINFDLSHNNVSGSDGCNSFSGTVQNLTLNRITLGPLASTSKMCPEMQLADRFNSLITTVTGFRFNKYGLLEMYNDSVTTLLTFMRNPNEKDDINGTWTMIRLNGSQFTRMNTNPTITFNAESKKVAGMDGCNDFNGTIKSITSNGLELGPIATTRKMCPDMAIPQEFGKAMTKVVGYTFKNHQLILNDAEGNELFAFIRKP